MATRLSSMVLVRIAMSLAVVLATGAVAGAQPTSASDDIGYVAGVVQSAFGNVTSQSFGAEIGVSIGSSMHVFVEGGRIRDSAPKSLGAAAQLIAGYLTTAQAAAVDYSVKQPASFGLAGVRYTPRHDLPVDPYVMGGVGIARVTKDVGFSVGGTDVTDRLQQFGVVLGSDLSGSQTNPMISLGGGVVWTGAAPLFVDLHYRYGRIFTSGQGTNVNRAGVAVGVSF